MDCPTCGRGDVGFCAVAYVDGALRFLSLDAMGYFPSPTLRHAIIFSKREDMTHVAGDANRSPAGIEWAIRRLAISDE